MALYYLQFPSRVVGLVASYQTKAPPRSHLRGAVGLPHCWGSLRDEFPLRYLPELVRRQWLSLSGDLWAVDRIYPGHVGFLCSLFYADELELRGCGTSGSQP